MTAICDVNGCKLLIHQYYNGYGTQGNGVRRQKVHSFLIVGTEADAALCGAFYTNLRDTVEELAKKNKPDGLARGEGKNWATSFKVGCVYAISSRLREGAQEAREAALIGGRDTALAVVDSRCEALENYMEEKYKRLKNRQPSKSKVNSAAYAAGHREGKKVNLSTKVLT